MCDFSVSMGSSDTTATAGATPGVTATASDEPSSCDTDECDSFHMHGPFAPHGAPIPRGCDPGDSKFPDDSTKSQITCQGESTDFAPYTIDGKTVDCSGNLECHLSAGGLCGTKKGNKAFHKCYYPTSAAEYTEWRPNTKLWEHEPARDVCVATQSQFRRWCDMPWTHSGKCKEVYTQPLYDRVKRQCNSKARPPWYYNSNDGTCHMTKSYCTLPTDKGGGRHRVRRL